ncbi:MAG: hypothetical protein ABIS27_13135 [Longimicrobiales bacterium]
MRERARAMRSRVLERLERGPLGLSDLQRVDRALSAALELRDAALSDDHDVDALHPGRTVLILVDDLAVTDSLLLAAGAQLESLRPELRSVPVDPEVMEVLNGIPTPRIDAGAGADAAVGTVGADDLLERLLSLSPSLLDVVLAERLDHARHLHLRDRSLWPEGLAVEEAVYLPLAQRRGGLIALRYERWHRAFAARAARAG